MDDHATRPWGTETKAVGAHQPVATTFKAHEASISAVVRVRLFVLSSPTRHQPHLPTCPTSTHTTGYHGQPGRGTRDMRRQKVGMEKDSRGAAPCSRSESGSPHLGQIRCVVCLAGQWYEWPAYKHTRALIVDSAGCGAKAITPPLHRGAQNTLATGVVPSRGGCAAGPVSWRPGSCAYMRGACMGRR